MKKITGIGLLVIFVLSLIVLSKNLEAECSDDIILFNKAYGTLAPRVTKPNIDTISRYLILSPDRAGIECAGGLGYYSDPKIQGVQSTRAKIGIAKYSIVDFMKSDLITLFFAENANTEKREYSSGQVLFTTYISRKRQVFKFGWISNNIWILGDTDDAAIKDEFINDYLTRYPPTVKFTEADFTRDSINRGQMKKYFQVITDAETYRAPQPARPKFERFIGFMAQCNAEIWTRTYAQIHDELLGGQVIGCPAAMEFDDAKRNKKYEALKQQVLAKTLDYDFDSIKLPEGVVPGTPQFYAPQIIQQLQMTEQDLTDLQSSDAPKEFKITME